MNEKELSAAVSLLKKLSHDVKTPLTTILGFTQMILEDETISESTREYLQLIEKDAIRMNEIMKSGMEQIEQLAAKTEN